MKNNPLDALHQTHTATNDVMKGYDTMLERAEPEIRGIISGLANMHRAHAAELETRLAALGDSGECDTSFRGSVNAAAVTLRDCVTGLDEGSLDAVERGEKALLDFYNDALQDWSSHDDLQTHELLEEQHGDPSSPCRSRPGRRTGASHGWPSAPGTSPRPAR